MDADCAPMEGCAFIPPKWRGKEAPFSSVTVTSGVPDKMSMKMTVLPAREQEFPDQICLHRRGPVCFHGHWG